MKLFGRLSILAVCLCVSVSFLVRPIKHLTNMIQHPDYGWCGKCLRTWDVAQGHWTTFSESGTFCFPLCKDCWTTLKTPKARLPYYRDMVDSWVRLEPREAEKLEEDWKLIKTAVLAGK